MIIPQLGTMDANNVSFWQLAVIEFFVKVANFNKCYLSETLECIWKKHACLGVSSTGQRAKHFKDARMSNISYMVVIYELPWPIENGTWQRNCNTDRNETLHSSGTYENFFISSSWQDLNVCFKDYELTTLQEKILKHPICLFTSSPSRTSPVPYLLIYFSTLLQPNWSHFR